MAPQVAAESSARAPPLHTGRSTTPAEYGARTRKPVAALADHIGATQTVLSIFTSG